MPKLGLEMERGIVLEWTVDEGEGVDEGGVLVEVESEKSIGEVDAREDGALRHVYVEEGEEVPPGTPIGILAAPDADISDLRADAEAELEEEAPEIAAAAGPDAGAASDAAAAGDADATSEANAADGGDAAAAQPSSGGASGAPEDLKASPRARKRAEELEVDLTTVEGTGPMGSITEADVEAAAESAAEADADPTAADATNGEEIKASPRARKRAAELEVDLTTVEGTGPMGSITEADVEDAAESAPEAETTAAAGAEAGSEATADVEISAAPTDAAGVRRIEPGDPLTDRYYRTTAVAAPAAANALFEATEAVRTAFEDEVTMTDLLVVLASATLADHPVLNGTYAESTHQVRERQNIALVAGSDDGPVSVVVPDARNRSLSEIVEARRAVDSDDADAATSDERATFTVANAAETEANGRLVDPPSVATLEIDPTGQRAVPNGDDVRLRPLVVATLTYDARAIGGNEAAAFLERLFDRAERASELVLGSYRGRE
ncbi:E3 binding domain protein [Haloterrigena salina JCM 13891]|uniref:E3 binding domain protein n=2 Tax=Haloterrigena salina TaxID=504937 RepID=M0BQI2_9EURY|nr:E3 binding domain protein [Haloterrigena salina JCM 13891]